MTSAAATHTASPAGARPGVHRRNFVVGIVGAIVGFVLTGVVLWLFQLWAGAIHASGHDAHIVGTMLFADGPSHAKLRVVGYCGALLGFLGGITGYAQLFRKRGFLRALFGAFIGYPVAVIIAMLIRQAFHMPAYSTRPLMLFGPVGSLAFYTWGIGAWTEWWRYMIGQPTPEHEDHSGHGARSWRSYFTFNTDHKVIGVQYVVTTFIFMMIAGALAEVIRAELANPGLQYIQQAQNYNAMFSVHAVLMIFLFIIPAFAGLANYVLPIMIGAPDMAFPRLNALSYWLLLFGGGVFVSSFFVGAFNSGWTNYAPLSVTGGPGGPYQLGELLFGVGVQIVGASSIMTAINFMVTIISMRAPGMTIWRMPLLVWANFTTSMLVVFGTPFIAGSQFMVMFDSVMHTKFFEVAKGGNPIMYQHVFWFYSHPAVYIMMVPGFGIISEVITTHARKPLFGYRSLALSTLAIGFLSFTVWAHHMFVSGMQSWIRIPMMMTTMLIAVPTGVKVLGWSATLWNGKIHLTTPMIFALGFLFTFTIGGLTGVMLASVPFDIHVSASYFVVAHIHYVLFGGAAFTIFAGVYHWFPKMTGRMYDEGLGRWHFWTLFIAMNATFFPMHWLGTMGMTRRIADYTALAQAHPSVHFWNFFESIGAFCQGASMLIFFYNMTNSWIRGPKAPANPWRSLSLEWQVSSPPPLFNFYATPKVVGGPYDFGMPGAAHAIVPTKEQAAAAHAAEVHH